MLIVLLLAAAQPAPASPPKEETINFTATMEAFLEWRACLDVLLGPPPRPRQPKRAKADAAFARCLSREAKLELAAKEAFGPKDGQDLFEKFSRDARAELNGSPLRR
jgi:hypothetical protein